MSLGDDTLHPDNQPQPMTLDEYQRQALFTDYPDEYETWYYALGIVGESGELADKIKKIYRNDKGLFTDDKRRAIALEVGDVLWYLTAMARRAGYTLEQVARMNIEKLRDRAARGVLRSEGDSR